MGLKRPTGLDTERESNLDQMIRDLEERIAHSLTYDSNAEVGLMITQLESLKQQHKMEINNGL